MTIRVLIADDDPLIRDVLSEVLDAESDMDVVAMASDAAETVLLAERHSPTVAVLDVRMPGGGARAAQELSKLVPAVRTVAFSAYGDLASITAMKRAGVIEYLVKGLPNADLIAAIRRVGSACA
jgi:DNA-binding NarL/FixJ family response regulator